MLVLGGTRFIGRVFCEKAVSRGEYEVTLLHRGVTGSELFGSCEHLHADRNELEQCRRVLANRSFNCIVDFSCMNPTQFENALVHCYCDHYTFLSSSAVDLSWPEDELFSMAQSKLWCEHLLQSSCSNSLIVRPGFVVGQYDYTNRFETDGVSWYWHGTKDPVSPLITVNYLCSTMLQLINRKHTGVVRAGYDKPRVRMNISM